MTFVTTEDNKLEKEIFDLIRPEMFREDVLFIQNKNKVAIYDFDGSREGKVVIRVDVKCLQGFANQYPTKLISVEKIQAARNEKEEVGHYIVYFTATDRMIRVYDIDDLDSRGKIQYEKNFRFTHKRSGREMVRAVFKLPVKDFLAEYYFAA